MGIRMIQFHANHVSASAEGDYYSVMFEKEADDLDRPYLVIQGQLEDPEHETCYVETHDPNYRGHFHVRRIKLTAQRLSVQLDRPKDNLITVTFLLALQEFQAASRIIKIISGEIEPGVE